MTGTALEGICVVLEKMLMPICSKSAGNPVLGLTYGNPWGDQKTIASTQRWLLGWYHIAGTWSERF